MSILDLQATLHEAAETVNDEGLAGRATAARNRAHAIRRRRRSVGAGVAAIAVVVPVIAATAFGANPLHRSAPTVNQPEPTPSVAAAFAGRGLLDSEVVMDRSELILSFESGSPTQWTATCYGVGEAYTVHMSLDGKSPGAAPCESAEPTEPQMGYVLDSRFPDGQHMLRVWLTRTGSQKLAMVPGSVLAAGVYRLPQPVTKVAGVDVYDLERADVDEWRYAASRESAVGERSVVATHQADGPLLAQLVATGVTPDQVRLLVDGIESPAASVLDGSGFLQLPAGRHTVELQIKEGAAQTAQLGVIWRTVAP